MMLDWRGGGNDSFISRQLTNDECGLFLRTNGSSICIQYVFMSIGSEGERGTIQSADHNTMTKKDD